MKPATVILLLGLFVAPLANAADDASLERMRQAAAAGSDSAQLEMGILYEFGFKMTKNEIDALAWYLLAAERGNTLAIKRRDHLKTTMKPAEIEAAEKLSRELLKPGGASQAEAKPAAEPLPPVPIAPAEPTESLAGPPAAPASVQ